MILKQIIYPKARNLWFSARQKEKPRVVKALLNDT